MGTSNNYNYNNKDSNNNNEITELIEDCQIIKTH